MPVFIAALFLVDKRWEQPWCSLVNEWRNKIPYTIEYYSAKMTCYDMNEPWECYAE
jgi:hypothetical protein